MKRIISWICPILFFSYAAEALTLDGHFTQGGLVIGRTTAGTIVIFNERQIRVSPEGIFVIGFNRDAKPNARLKLIYKNGQVLHRILSIAQRKYKIEKITGLPSAKVSPPGKVLAKIKFEAELVSKTREIDTPATHFLQNWVWPAKGRISGVYGSQRVLNGLPKRPHYGIDIAAPTGTKVVSPNSGIIRMVHNDMYLSGGTVIIDHGHGVSSALLHLKSIAVKEGQLITRGDVIGTIGASGRATGPHLDWRINLFKRRLDPELLMHPGSRTRN